MRFLMNTLLALISTAVDSCVLAKLSLDALGRAAVFVSSAKPGSRHPGLLCAAKLQLSVFWHQFNQRLKAPATAIYASESLSAVVCTPSLMVLFPYVEQPQG